MPGSPFTSRKGKSKKKDKGKVTAPQQGLSMSAQLGQDGLPKMPPQEELDKELATVLEVMNIPKSKAAEFMQQSNVKKWHLILNQRMTQAATPTNAPGQ
eukprot:gene23345-17840_t